MAKKKRQVQAKVTPKQKGKISERQRFDDEIIFSFKYLDLYGNSKFSIDGCGENYLAKLLLRFKDLSKHWALGIGHWELLAAAEKREIA